MSVLRMLAVWPDAGASAITDSLSFFVGCSRLAGDASFCLEALIVGPALDEAHAGNARQAGATSVVTAAHAGLAASDQSERWLAVMQPLVTTRVTAQSPDLVVFPAGALGEELAARLAVRVQGMPLGVCHGLERQGDGWAATKFLQGGRVRAAVALEPGNAFMAIQVHKAMPGRQGTAAATTQNLTLDHALPGAEHVEQRPLTAGRKPLENARIIVSGGRGLDEQGFALLRELADELGAAVGGSLPAVDAGWVPVSHQIGQSGKYVAPDLYIAVGISGTPQHMAGVAPHARIIAVNRDREAGIFETADTGVVADWKLLLPALLRRLRA